MLSALGLFSQLYHQEVGRGEELLCDLKCALERGVSWRVRLHQTDAVIEVGQQQHL